MRFCTGPSCVAVQGSAPWTGSLGRERGHPENGFSTLGRFSPQTAANAEAFLSHHPGLAPTPAGTAGPQNCPGNARPGSPRLIPEATDTQRRRGGADHRPSVEAAGSPLPTPGWGTRGRGEGAGEGPFPPHLPRWHALRSSGRHLPHLLGRRTRQRLTCGSAPPRLASAPPAGGSGACRPGRIRKARRERRENSRRGQSGSGPARPGPPVPYTS